jgi:PST family polysaccharide transporter
MICQSHHALMVERVLRPPLSDPNSQSSFPPGADDPGAAPAAGPSLTTQAATGVAWFGFVTVFNKAIAFFGQIVLGWILLPADFGLVALMYGVMMFINLVREAGLLQVLTHRSTEMDRLSGPATWISGILGLLASGLLVLVAPGVAKLFDTPQLIGLLHILAIGCVFDALATVPYAKLQIDLRFQYIAVQAFALSLLQMAVTILLAWYGFGAASVAWSLVVASVARSVSTWIAAGVTPFRPPAFGYWTGLLKSGSIVTGSYFLYVVTLQGDRFALQLFHNETVVGIYFFAYNLSVQALVMTSSHLANVLMPTLSRLNFDPPRQARAFLRAIGLMMMIGSPVCFAQAALAGPVMRVLFKPEYHSAIWPLRLLSIAMVFRLAGYCAVSLLQAQGRFRTHGIVMAIQVPLWLGSASFAAWWNGPTGVAVAMIVVNALIDPVLVLLAVRGQERPVEVLQTIFVRPFIVSTMAFLPCVVLIDVCKVLDDQPVLQLLIGVLIAAPLYWVILRWAAPQLHRELLQNLAPLLGRFRRSVAGVF